MASAIPHRVPAGGARCGNVAQLTGVDNVTGEQWGLMEFNNTVGSGACHGADGWPLYGASGVRGDSRSRRSRKWSCSTRC